MIQVKYNLGSFVSNTNPTESINGITNYSHKVDIIGGYDTASINFSMGSISQAEEWIEEGVGRHIKVYSRYGNIIWEGLVNTVKFIVGKRTLSIGAYLDIINRVKVAYTLRDPPLGTPDEDRYLETDWASYGPSVRRYGILEELVSGGSGYSPEMDALRDQVLTDNTEPLISESLPAGNNEGGSVSISLDCIGYYRLLDKQVYYYGTTTEYDDLSVKVASILSANANARHFIRTKSLSTIGYDALLHETQGRTAWGIIKDDISKTPIGDNGIICGMFAENTFVLKRSPNTIAFRRDGGSDIIKDASNIEVAQSEVTPGGLMLNNDLSVPISYRIKSVSYTLNSNIVQINQNQRSIGEALSRKMLGGMF